MSSSTRDQTPRGFSMADQPVQPAKVVKPLPADMARPGKVVTPVAAAPKVVAPVAASPAAVTQVAPPVTSPPPPPPERVGSFVSPYPINGTDGLPLDDPVPGEPPVNQLF